MTRLWKTLLIAITTGSLAIPAMASVELNLYSSRHYDTDERLYSDFEKQTGITINRIEAKAGALMTRMQSEGENSPADILLTVDAGNIWRAGQMGILQPIESETLNTLIPPYLRDPDGKWYGLSQRARMIFFDKEDVANPPRSYAELADPEYKGMICARSSSNIYMISLLASRVAHEGEEAATAWAQGLYDNFARKPSGGDTDQLRGLVSGECDIVLANSYYFARALRKDVRGVSDHVDQIGWVFPDQALNGTHVNLSIGGVAKHAPNKENAIRFLEYLVSEQAQKYFSAGNDEYPAVPGVGLAPSVAALGLFRQDTLPLYQLGENQRRAVEIYDRIGYE